MDGRPHPQNPSPSHHGHSIGKWEGDTLAIDSVGFNEASSSTRGRRTTQMRAVELRASTRRRSTTRSP
jgi:hypothetical protein